MDKDIACEGEDILARLHILLRENSSEIESDKSELESSSSEKIDSLLENPDFLFKIIENDDTNCLKKYKKKDIFKVFDKFKLEISSMLRNNYENDLLFSLKDLENSVKKNYFGQYYQFSYKLGENLQQDIFLFCLILKKRKISKYLWENLKNSIHLALIAIFFCKKMLSNQKDKCSKETLELIEDLEFWKNKSITFLDSFYNKFPMNALNYVMKIYPNSVSSILTLAKCCKYNQILLTDCCQLAIKNTFQSNFSTMNFKSLKILLCIFCPVFIVFLKLDGRKKYLVNVTGKFFIWIIRKKYRDNSAIRKTLNKFNDFYSSPLVKLYIAIVRFLFSFNS